MTLALDPAITPQRQASQPMKLRWHLGHLDAERVGATLGAIGTPARRTVEATRPRIVPVHPQSRGSDVYLTLPNGGMTPSS